MRAPFENGARSLCKGQDVLAFAGASLPAALGSFSATGVFAAFTAGFGFIAAAALVVRSLKDISSIL